MILKKLEEALAEIPKQRKALDGIEAQLRSMIFELSGAANTPQEFETFIFDVEPETEARPRRVSRKRKKHDKLDDFVEIIRSVGHPIHIVELAERYSTKVGKAVTRTEIEPGINRHLTKTKAPRIAKFAPSTFGLPEWKGHQPTLAQIAS